MILIAYWGKVAQPGSLSNLRSRINRNLVDKQGKTFSVMDEFIVHTFTSHLLAAICDELHLETPEDEIQHEPTLEWLNATAKAIVENKIMPKQTSDSVNLLHRSFLYAGFMYNDLRNSIQRNEGEHIVRHWRHWLVQ